jgi:CRP-like cAMP-binding protein
MSADPIDTITAAEYRIAAKVADAEGDTHLAEILKQRAANATTSRDSELIDLDALETYLKARVEKTTPGRQVAWTASPELVLALITRMRDAEQRLAESDERNSNLFDLGNKHLDTIDRVKALAEELRKSSRGEEENIGDAILDAIEGGE